MSTTISQAAASAAVAAIAAQLSGGTLTLYTGAQPANPDTTATGTALAALTLPAPAFGEAAEGIVVAATIPTDQSADNTGTAGWFRGCDSAGNPVIDGAVTATGGGGDMTMASTTITAGQPVSITSWSITMPVS